MLPIIIRGADSYVAAKVSNIGELLVAPFAPNETQHHSMTSINTAYVFAPPKGGQRMRLQNILMYGNKSVGTGDANVIIYTSRDPTALTGNIVMELELPKYATRDLIGINLELPAGQYLLAKTDDNDVFMTMMGYYVDDPTEPSGTNST